MSGSGSAPDSPPLLVPAVQVSGNPAGSDPAPAPPGETGPVAPAEGHAGRAAQVLARFHRKPSREDAARRARQAYREQEAYRVGLIRIRERGLAMKLTRVAHAIDGSRLIFYFTAEGRIDFRELVRELAAEFRMRIEMRQIGVRDEARMLGGYGSCGRPLCCAVWLQGFEPVSIKMAKQQDLSLNPWKLSGLCGRLKCCLRYELADGRHAAKKAGKAKPGEPLEGRPFPDLLD